MNKWLLVWNVVLMVLITVLVLGGCSSDTQRVTSLTSQVEADRVAIAQLQATVAQHTQQIQGQAAQMAALQASTQTSLQQLSASIQQYVQQYVQQQLGK